MNRWCTACASVIGTSHIHLGLPCQDRGVCKVVDDILIAAVADGAGTSSHSAVGAQMAVDTFIHGFGDPTAHDNLAVWIASLQEVHFRTWLVSVQGLLAEQAQRDGRSLVDYACTFLGVVATPAQTLYFQIGDGAIITADDAVEYKPVFWPQHGQYANMTNFMTQVNALDVCEFAIGGPVTEFAMFTDGMERLVIDHLQRKVHPPSIAPIFHWLRGLDPASTIGDEAVAAYLESAHINGRTDDDKTLLMATRRC